VTAQHLRGAIDPVTSRARFRRLPTQYDSTFPPTNESLTGDV